jgi:hypothetical protein
LTKTKQRTNEKNRISLVWALDTFAAFTGVARAHLTGLELGRNVEMGCQARNDLQGSTLKTDETGEPLQVQHRRQIEAYRSILRYVAPDLGWR